MPRICTGIAYTLDAASTAGGNIIDPSTGALTYAAGWSGVSTITATADGCNGPSTSTHSATSTPSVGTPDFILGSSSTRCQGAATIMYTATSANSTGITYSIDAASTAGGVIINTTNGNVIYPAGWSGTSIITASATGCNGPVASTHTGNSHPNRGHSGICIGINIHALPGSGNGNIYCKRYE